MNARHAARSQRSRPDRRRSPRRHRAVRRPRRAFKAQQVIANGTIGGRGRPDRRRESPISIPRRCSNSIKLATLRRGRFPCAGRQAVAYGSQRSTSRASPNGVRSEAEVEDGFVVPPAGTTMIAVAHRHGKADGRPRVGFLTGWGEWRGAFCTTVSHDSHNLTVFGGNVRRHDDCRQRRHRCRRRHGGRIATARSTRYCRCRSPAWSAMRRSRKSPRPSAPSARPWTQIVDWQTALSGLQGLLRRNARRAMPDRIRRTAVLPMSQRDGCWRRRCLGRFRLMKTGADIGCAFAEGVHPPLSLS